MLYWNLSNDVIGELIAKQRPRSVKSISWYTLKNLSNELTVWVTSGWTYKKRSIFFSIMRKYIFLRTNKITAVDNERKSVFSNRRSSSYSARSLTMPTSLCAIIFTNSKKYSNSVSLSVIFHFLFQCGNWFVLLWSDNKKKLYLLFDERFGFGQIYFIRIAQCNRWQRNVPRTIVSFQWNDCWIGHVTDPLHPARIKRCVHYDTKYQ